MKILFSEELALGTWRFAQRWFKNRFEAERKSTFRRSARGSI